MENGNKNSQGDSAKTITRWDAVWNHQTNVNPAEKKVRNPTMAEIPLIILGVDLCFAATAMCKVIGECENEQDRGLVNLKTL